MTNNPNFFFQTASVHSSTTVRAAGSSVSVMETSVSAWQVNLTQTSLLSLGIRSVCVTIVVSEKAKSKTKRLTKP